MRQELYATLREKIVKVVPEIMKLEFGCHVLIRLTEGGGTKATVLGTKGKTILTTFAKFHENKESVQSDLHYAILGRDITLADVLRAISKMPHRSIVDFVVGADGGFFERPIGSKHFVRLATWNTALPFHLQEDAVGELLITVIK